jgi:glycosyltransferase involved in cell wall biosynthesis
VRTDLWFGLQAGGAIAHAAGILNAFSNAGSNVRLLTSQRLPIVASEIEQVVVRPRRIWFPLPEWSLQAYNRDLVAASDDLDRPQFVYQRNGLYGYAGLLLARRWNVPFVLEYNGSEVWVGDHWGRPVRARQGAVEVEDLMIRSADLVTVVSRPLIQDAVARGAETSRVLLCPNAVDPARYHPDIDGSAVRSRYGLGDSVVIGFIGTFGPWHGTVLLTEAFAALEALLPPGANVRLLMIGDGHDLAAAKAVIAQAGLSAKAVFAGLVPQQDGPAHLAAADILVNPTQKNPDGSEFFGSPTKLYEYMGMGRAIVAARLGQMAEVLEDGRTALLTPPGDRAALASALARLCVDRELRFRLSSAARREVEEKHTWRHRVAAIKARLARVAGGPIA